MKKEEVNVLVGDNRFEIISKAKEKIIKGTNIESSKEEMRVLDNILFRIWQMGWIDESVLENNIGQQYLMQEERKLLECLRENYNCKSIYFDEEIGEWIILSENSEGMYVRANFNECTFTLNRHHLFDIDELLK